MQNKKKRIVAKDIEGIVGERFKSYADEFDYPTSSGIAHGVKVVANPIFPLAQSEDKNLLNYFLNGDLYPARAGYVLSNERKIKSVGMVIYLPICFVMFIKPMTSDEPVLI